MKVSHLNRRVGIKSRGRKMGFLLKRTSVLDSQAVEIDAGHGFHCFETMCIFHFHFATSKSFLVSQEQVG